LPPPGGYATTNRIDLLGYAGAWAAAGPDTRPIPTTAHAAAITLRRDFIELSW
jgi:hypothetical protein